MKLQVKSLFHQHCESHKLPLILYTTLEHNLLQNNIISVLTLYICWVFQAKKCQLERIRRQRINDRLEKLKIIVMKHLGNDVSYLMEDILIEIL